MKWSSFLTREEKFNVAMEALINEIQTEFSEQPDIFFVYFSSYYQVFADEISAGLKKAFNGTKVAGCIAGTVLFAGDELSNTPAIAVMAAHLPNCKIQTKAVDLKKMPCLDSSPRKWRDFIGMTKESNQTHFIFSDPFTEGFETLIQGIDYAYSSTVLGAFSSGIEDQSDQALVCEEQIIQSGAVIVSISGDLQIVPLVTQGCQPVGENLKITSCSDVVLEKIDDQDPITYLRDLSPHLNETERELLQKSLFLGVEMDCFKAEHASGDFLIRNIRGVDADSGALVVGEHLHNGQVVRFHIRDKQIGSAELNKQISYYAGEFSERKCHGVMAFSCLGRVKTDEEQIPDGELLAKITSDDIPVCGFFGNGEFGPVGGTTYIHGYTVAAALIFDSAL
ncbi:MAG: FIST C-terminal domain-containing protein [Lentisphaeraceae bacterium]|nr:FIST C-terminal domain-containing protein [Lentisphaeraceae bacterium]